MITFTFLNKSDITIKVQHMGNFTFGQIKHNVLKKFDDIMFYSSFPNCKINDDDLLNLYTIVMINGCNEQESEEIHKIINEYDDELDNVGEMIMEYSEADIDEEIKDEQFKKLQDDEETKNELLNMSKIFKNKIENDDNLISFVKTYFKHPEYLDYLLMMHHKKEIYDDKVNISDEELQELSDTLNLIFPELDNNECEKIIQKSNYNIFTATYEIISSL